MPFPHIVSLSKGNNILVVNRIETVIMKMKATYQLFLFSNMTILEYADLNNREVTNVLLVYLIRESIYEKKTNYDFGLPVLVYRNGIGTNSSYRHRSVSR